jgi:hypothetical protein
MTVKKSSDDSEDPELPEEEEFFHDEKISINAGLNKDATFVSLPGSFNTFSQINSLSQFSIFVNSKVIVYFFALDESTWEFRAYADGGDVKNKVAGTPYLLVSGKLKFSDTGEFPNAKSAQSAEVMWRGSNITSVITFNVTTILREGSSSADSTSTFE